MSKETTQPSLLSRVRDLDNHSAWREFDAKYRELILRYCRQRGLQTADAEDVRQMVMLNLARGLRSFQYQAARGRFRDYLGRTVQNSIHRFFRRPRLESEGLDNNNALLQAEETGQDEKWDREWMLHHYRLALEHLRTALEPRTIEVFEHLLAGETVDETARSFEMTRAAVHKVKQRMRDRLRERIIDQIHDEELPEPSPS